MANKVCDNPLIERYASPEMSYIWSPHKKFSTWRRLWFTLAEAEHELGLQQVTKEQLEELQEHLEVNDESIKRASDYEKKFRHDVMSHVHSFGDDCPKSKGIIHLGATSCFVGDNTDLVQMKDSMELVQKKLLRVIYLLKEFSQKHAELPTLGFTHFQPAQLTTVGKRATLWLQDFLLDFDNLMTVKDKLQFRGVKGTTGTQASFLDLFEGDHEKVRDLDRRITKKMGFKKTIAVTGQTYTRKQDYSVMSAVVAVSHSAQKLATDIRLLMHLKELEEPFEKNQIGSSAMAYKRNPMRCERICALSRFSMSLLDNSQHTHSNQWFERTLDDSANRRLALSLMFLTIDGILNIVSNVVDGMVVWPHVIRKHVMEELPFMATENILMECVKKGGDRQVLHESIRVHSMEAARRVKEEGAENDLMSRIKNDKDFSVVHGLLDSMVDPRQFVGRCPEQVKEFISEEVDPVLEQYKDLVPDAKQDFKLKV
ncbi:adenylosuccinate lyase [Acrasis kona]|uniref:Adenylosuccinate lyase n=1 Tax=Acrasis kona TaxID=1008807 RepID=A0AAW2ZFW4_9EUKA